MPTRPTQRCQPCARPHSASSVPPVPPLTTPQAPQNARLMTALHSRARLRPARSQMSTGHLRKPLTTSIPHRHQTCRAEYPKHPTSRAKPVRSAATPKQYRSSQSFTPARVSPEASPSPPLSPVTTDALILRPWET